MFEEGVVDDGDADAIMGEVDLTVVEVVEPFVVPAVVAAFAHVPAEINNTVKTNSLIFIEVKYLLEG